MRFLIRFVPYQNFASCLLAAGAGAPLLVMLPRILSLSQILRQRIFFLATGTVLYVTFSEQFTRRRPDDLLPGFWRRDRILLK